MRRLSLLIALALLALGAGCGDLMMSGQSAAEGEDAAVAAGPFDGVYVLDEEASFGPSAGQDSELTGLSRMMFSPLTVRGDTIRYGRLIVGQFDLHNPVVTGDVLTSDALWHEDLNDPGDMHEVRVELRRDGDRLHFTHYDPGEDEDFRPTLVYRRSRS